MNPSVLFWTPAVLRLAVVLSICVFVAWWRGAMVGALFAIAALVFLLYLQLRYLRALDAWLDDPAVRLPDGWGAWSEIFARAYRLRREDELAKAELAEWLQRFREAMARLPDGVAIVDDVLFLEWCNEAAERHLGIDPKRDLGLRITNLVRHPRFIDYLILGEFDSPLEIEVNQHKLRILVVPFESRRRIIVTHDMTQQARMDRMRRDFLANASHELRTPLTVINGFLEVADTDSALPEDMRKRHLHLMRQQGRRMQALVEDMLSLTSLESTEAPLQQEWVHIESLLQGVLEDARALSNGEHVIELQLDGPDLRGSAEELHSAFSNLTFNAVRYTPAGGRIQLSWEDSESGPLLKVSDTGVGIAAEHLPRLTERFYRVDQTRENRGTGLGLAIVKHVLLRHGGHLDIQSTPGKGSTFSAQFPRRMAVLSE